MVNNKERLFNKPNTFIAGALTQWDMNKNKWVSIDGKNFEFYTDCVRHTVKWLESEVQND